MPVNDARLESVITARLLCGPETLQINLNNSCNLNCIFCWNHSPLQTPPTKEFLAGRLSDSHLDNVVGSLERLRPSYVTLSGRGEPLLHPNVRILLSELRRLTIPVTVHSNGIGGLEPEEFVEYGLATVMLNLSAATADGYERTHPGRGKLLSRIEERMKRLSGLDDAPEVIILAVIQKTNFTEMAQFVDFAKEVGVKKIVFKGMELFAGLEELLFNAEEKQQARGYLDAANARAQQLSIDLSDGHLRKLLTEQKRDGSFSRSMAKGPCYAGWYYLRVTTDGNVMFCCKDKRVGRLQEHRHGHLDRYSLYQIWRSPHYHLQRIAGRDGDISTGLFDRKCDRCSNYLLNDRIREDLDRYRKSQGKGF
jgi:MoaA/NifB/PqqE/SkfB family radical SAM enzyme